MGLIKPHRFLDTQELRNSAFELNNQIKLGREIYLGAMPEFENDPWHLVTGIYAALPLTKDSRSIDIEYSLHVETLSMIGYGHFFSGSLDFVPEIENRALRTLQHSTILDSWQQAEEVLGDFDATRRCAHVSFRKSVRNSFKRHGNVIGQEYLIDGRGDVPVSIIGMSIKEDGERSLQSRQSEILAHYMVENYSIVMHTPLTSLRPLPRSIDTLKTLSVQKVG